jgi:RNA polymerase sigma factor (sigma-70 family)
MSDYWKLLGEGLYGDVAAVILRLDLVQAFKHLSNRQKYVVWCYFMEGYTQQEIGNLLGVSQRMVSDYIDTVCKRIAATLEGEGGSVA